MEIGVSLLTKAYHGAGRDAVVKYVTLLLPFLASHNVCSSATSPPAPDPPRTSCTCVDDTDGSAQDQRREQLVYIKRQSQILFNLTYQGLGKKESLELKRCVQTPNVYSFIACLLFFKFKLPSSIQTYIKLIKIYETIT